GSVQDGPMRDDASGGFHHVEVAVNGPLETLQISNDERFNVGVEGRRGRSLELAELGEDFVACRDRKTGQRLRESLLVRGMEEGEEKRDRNGLRPARTDFSGDRLQVALRRGPEDPASRVHPLTEPEAPFSRDGRRRTSDPEIVERRPILATDEQQVLKALRRDERGAGTLPLQDRVRGHGGSVRHPRCTKGPHPFDDRLRRILGARHLQGNDLAAVKYEEIRDGSADVTYVVHGVVWRGMCPARE